MDGVSPLRPGSLPTPREPHAATPPPVDQGLRDLAELGASLLPLPSRKRDLLEGRSATPSGVVKAQLARFPHRSLRVGPDHGGAGVSDEVLDVLRQMVIETPSDQALLHLASEVRVLGVGLLQSLYRFGTTVVLLRRDTPLTEFTVRDMHVVIPDAHTSDGREYHQVRGLYKKHLRLILIGEEQLGNPSLSTAIHEFGHAWDHAYSTECRLMVDVSVTLWNSLAPSRTGVLDPYAATNPCEYFAVCFEAFYRPAARRRLEAIDPAMAAWLESLPAF